MQCYQEVNEPAYIFLKQLKHIIKWYKCDLIVEEINLVNLFISRIHLKSTQKSLLTIAAALHIAKTEEATIKQIDALHIPLENSACSTNYNCKYVQTCRSWDWAHSWENAL